MTKAYFKRGHGEGVHLKRKKKSSYTGSLVLKFTWMEKNTVLAWYNPK